MPPQPFVWTVPEASWLVPRYLPLSSVLHIPDRGIPSDTCQQCSFSGEHSVVPLWPVSSFFSPWGWCSEHTGLLAFSKAGRAHSHVHGSSLAILWAGNAHLPEVHMAHSPIKALFRRHFNDALPGCPIWDCRLHLPLPGIILFHCISHNLTILCVLLTFIVCLIPNCIPSPWNSA